MKIENILIFLIIIIFVGGCLVGNIIDTNKKAVKMKYVVVLEYCNGNKETHNINGNATTYFEIVNKGAVPFFQAYNTTERFYNRLNVCNYWIFSKDTIK